MPKESAAGTKARLAGVAGRNKAFKKQPDYKETARAAQRYSDGNSLGYAFNPAKLMGDEKQLNKAGINPDKNPRKQVASKGGSIANLTPGQDRTYNRAKGKMAALKKKLGK